MSSTTPNMTLIIPDVGTTVGPTWASELNTALEVVDEHDHTSGKGVKVPVAGLNINGDLSFASHDIIDLNAVVLDDLSADVSTATSIYVKNGELFYIDDAATSTQITSNGSVAGATGTISGMTGGAAVEYSLLNQQYSFLFDASSPAKLLSGDLDLYPFDGATVYSDYVTLRVDTAIGAQYDWVFPLAVPSKTSPLIWTGAGVVDDIELANGEILVGSTAGAVAKATLTATANQTTVTNGANSITVGTVQDIGTGSSPTFTSVTASSNVNIADGGLTTPSLRFASSTTTGFHRSGTTVRTSGTAFLVPAGTEALPGLSFFTAGSDNGMYAVGTDSLGISTAGTNAVTISSTQDVTLAQDLVVGGSVNIDGGGTFKVTRYTGNLGAGATTTLTPGGSILGAFGYTEINNSSLYSPIAIGSGSNRVQFRSTGTSVTTTSMVIENTDPADANSYQVVVFHT